MSRLIKLSKINNLRHTTNKKPLNQGIISLGYLILFIILAFFIVFYLIQVNKLASASFRLRDLEKQIEELKEANRNLELEINNLISLETIEKASKKMGLVKGEEVEYLTPVDPVIAVK